MRETSWLVEFSEEMLEMELAARCKAVIRSVMIIEEKKDWIWTSFGGFYFVIRVCRSFYGNDVFECCFESMIKM